MDFGEPFRGERPAPASFWGSMTATSQASLTLCTTTPPAEISRTMAPKLSGLRELVTGGTLRSASNRHPLTVVSGTPALELAS